MAKKKHKRKKGKVPPHLKKYLFKKKGKKRRKHSHKGGHVAKKRKSKKRHHSHGGKRKSHRRRRHHRGGGGGTSTTAIVPLLAGGAAIGFIEHQMKSDANFVLNKLPTPVAQLGRLGNVTLLAWGAMKLFGGSIPAQVRTILGHGVRAGATITAYQFMRKQQAGAPFKEGAEVFTISGLPFDRRAEEQLVGDDEMGELEEEVGRHMRGSFDLEVDEPHPDDVHDVHDEPIHADDEGHAA